LGRGAVLMSGMVASVQRVPISPRGVSRDQKSNGKLKKKSSNVGYEVERKTDSVTTSGGKMDQTPKIQKT